MTTSIGLVIQPGQPIPDDVTEVKDGAKSPWRLTSKGHWHLRTAQITCLNDDCGGDGRSLMRQVGQRLTVTAVREQPAEPEDVHYYFTELRTGLTYCGVDALEEDGVSTTSESGKATCTACLVAAGEDPPGARDADGFLRLKGTATGDNQLDPEPQQADASPVLDLVLRYGDARWSEGTELDGGGSNWGAARAKAAALLDHIAAIEPQQPVQARDETGRLLWINKEGCVSPGADDGDNAAWLPLLVGGDPAPERCGAEACNQPAGHDGLHDSRRVSASLRDRHEPHVDGPREPSAQECADHDLMAALGVEQVGEVIPAIEHLKALVDHLRNWRSEHDKRERERDEARAEVERLQAAAAPPYGPDPLKLSRPKVPLGTVTLTGLRTGDRYRQKLENGWWYYDTASGSVDGGALDYILAREHPRGARVELAPPREPRTWPKLDEEHADLPGTVTVERHGTWRRLAFPDDCLYKQSDDGFGAIKVGLRLPLSGLQLLGEVTEVTE